MIKKLSFVLLLLLCSHQVFAGNGSLYSRFGIGELQYNMTPQAVGMGGAGIAVSNPFYINRSNPATLSEISQVRLFGDFFFNSYSAETSSASATQSIGGFSGVGIALPIWKLAVSSGLYPYSRFDYDQLQTGTLATPTGTSSDYEFRYKGVGGLNMVPIAIGFSPVQNSKIGTVRVGLSYNFMFGTFERSVENRYTNTDFSDSDFLEHDHIAGQTLTIGLGYETKKGLFRNEDKLAVGIAYTTSRQLSADRQTVISASAGTDTISTVNSKVTLPATLAIGLAYHASPTVTFALDVISQKWSELKYFNDDVSYRRDALRIGFGAEVIPTTERRAPYWKKIAYRAGVYSNQTYLKFDGNEINELGFTLGFGLPIANESSRLDLGFEYALHGTTSNDLIKENVFRVKIGLSIGEDWFQQSTID
ncbi:MAG: hypothetical protein HGB19_09685 [Chlorobiales bacterium]|nr:hypothetical protein [Chlorobiales bacterium]